PFSPANALSLDEAATKVLPATSSINWAYISLLLLKTASLGICAVPEDTFLILLLIRSLLSVFDNPIILIIKPIYQLFFLILLQRTWFLFLYKVPACGNF